MIWTDCDDKQHLYQSDYNAPQLFTIVNSGSPNMVDE